MPNRDAEEEITVITITTDRQTSDAGETSTATDEHPEADEITEINASPPITVTGRTLTAETPMSSSSIGCSTEISTRFNGWDPMATPTKPSDTVTESSEKDRVCGRREGRVESANKDVYELFKKFPRENQEVRRPRRIRTAKRVVKMGALKISDNN